MRPHLNRDHTTSPCVWIEQQVDDWVRAKIKRQPWIAVEPDKPNFVRKEAVMRRVGLSNMHIWRLEQRGEFPKRMHLENIFAADEAAE